MLVEVFFLLDFFLLVEDFFLLDFFLPAEDFFLLAEDSSGFSLSDPTAFLEPILFSMLPRYSLIIVFGLTPFIGVSEWLFRDTNNCELENEQT